MEVSAALWLGKSFHFFAVLSGTSLDSSDGSVCYPQRAHEEVSDYALLLL